jgi:hypothetical protein
MKVQPSEKEKLDTVRIFHPAKENWNVLYVEFGNEYQVDKLFSYTRGMVKQDHRVVRWYPRQMYDRYRAVESIAYEIRKKLSQKTRVKIGRKDIVLSTREAGSVVWKRQALPDNLPKFDLDSFSGPATSSSSPPPGRPSRSQIPCRECDYQVTYKSNLTQHQQAIHEGKQYTCRECDYQATYKSNLTQHQRAIHEGKQYPCRECDYQVTYKSNLTQHQQAIHEGKGMRLPGKSNLTQHQRGIHKRKKYLIKS